MAVARIHEAELDALSARAEHETKLIAQTVDLSRALARLEEECRMEVHHVIGAAKLEAYDAARRQTKQRLASLREKTPRATAELARAAKDRAKVLKEAKDFLAAQGVDVGKIREVQRRYKEKARALVDAAIPIADVPHASFELPEVRALATAWQTLLPPYAGQWGWTDYYSTRGSYSVRHFENRFSGELFTDGTVRVTDADDFDEALTRAWSEFSFSYRMPAAGIIELLLTLQASDTYYGGWLDDEWGVSDAEIIQRTQVYFVAGGTRYSSLLEYTRGESEGSWNGAAAAPGGYRYAHLFSLQSFAAGQVVYCRVGINDFNYLWVNDMSCNIWLRNRWFVPRVLVRSTGP